MKTENTKPQEGLAGLKQFWKTDIVSGFLVFLLALPLSLGIAKASGFPASMGVLTAMIGGLVVSWFKVSPLTIKGPAAGLITICSGAIFAMGGFKTDGAVNGWHMACGIIVVMGLLQIVSAYLKLGNYSEFFPISAVHGMLAAIGLIIIGKQIPVLLGDEPAIYKELPVIGLFTHIGEFITHEDIPVAIIGVISLIIMFTYPLIKINALKKIPAAMVVLMVAIPYSILLNFKATEPDHTLVTIGNFWSDIKINASFAGIGKFDFWKYVVIFLFVNSLESLLTVKAVDGLDPHKRKSDYNGDLKALGIGNSLSGLLGGLPMISEVVRSSANTNFGAQTKWSNFFHGCFLLIAMVLFIPVIELIPNAALAAMLIFAGYRLASPKHFIHSYQVGIDQFVVFIVTIAVTILEDLLLGIACGIVVNFIFQAYYKMPLGKFFKSDVKVNENGSETTVVVYGGATFSNYIGIKKYLQQVKKGNNLTIDLSNCKFVDHSVMEALHNFEQENKIVNGGNCKIIGLEKHRKISNHQLSGRILV